MSNSIAKYHKINHARNTNRKKSTIECHFVKFFEESVDS